MRNLLLVTIYILLSSSSFAFFARWISDPKQMCAEVNERESLDQKLTCIQDNSDIKLLADFRSFGDQLKSKVVDTYDDLSAARNLSEKIISESNDSLRKFKKHYRDRKNSSDSKSSNDYEDKLNQEINLIANLEYQIKINQTRYSCQMGRVRGEAQLEKHQRCKERRSEILTPLLTYKAMIESQNPILVNKNISSLIDDMTDERISKHNQDIQSISNCEHRSRRGSRKDIKCGDKNSIREAKNNDSLSLSRSDYDNAVNKALLDSQHSANTLIRRHSRILDRFDSLYSKPRQLSSLEDFRDDLFTDREIATDYFVSAGGSSEKGAFGNFRCRMVNEHKANEKNEFINSIALDIAVMAIPMGGPLILARSAMRLKSLVNTGTNLARIEKLTSTAGTRISTITFELGAMGYDTSNLTKQSKHCEEMLGRVSVIGIIPDEVKNEITQCQETLNEITTAYVTAMLGGSIGLVKLPKGLSQIDVAQDLKNSKLEVSLSTEKIDELINVKQSGGFPLLSRRDIEVFATSPNSTKFDIEYKVEFGKTQKTSLSKDELEAFLKDSNLDEFKISNVYYKRDFKPEEEAIILSKINSEDLSNLKQQSTSSNTFLAHYDSGEIGVYTGNETMIKELALRNDIAKLEYTLSPPYSAKSGYKVSSAERAKGFDPTLEMYQSVKADSIIELSKDNLSDYSNLTFHHGTLKAMEESVRSGPKNVGKGFGGAGLYIDISSDARIAKEYAQHARSAAENRLRNIDPNASQSLKTADMSAVVLKGKLNIGEKKLRVGKFEIVRGGNPDLENGILPSNWDEDPRLVRMMEERFDILDLRGMKSNGLNLATDRMLVIHESAGADIVKWD